MENYDTDKLIAAFGFGGIPNYSLSKETSHCFHLNGLPAPECQGILGLMEAYNFSITNVKLHGPTYFAPCIKACTDFIRENLDKPLYHIMLILTDGDIHDMQKTKDLIVEASTLPLSIIIVGVGDEDFELMVELDGDDTVIRNYKGQPALRDIVQFVKFEDYKNAGLSALAEEVLKEVPEQVVSYLSMNEIKLN